MKPGAVTLLFLLAACAAIVAPVQAGTLLVANKTDDTVDLVDPATGKSGATLPTGHAPHEIAVSPDGSTLATGTAQAFTARGLLTDGTRQDLTDQVTWSTSDVSIATVSNASGSHGLVQGVGVGNVDISASLLGVGGSVPLEVSAATLDFIDVSPFQQSIAKGAQVQFTAMGNYTDSTSQDLTSQVTWTSSDGAIADSVGLTRLAATRNCSAPARTL